MAISKLNNNLKLDGDQYCYNVRAQQRPEPGDFMQMHIPKLMPNIPFGSPKMENHTLNIRGIFQNASTCGISVPSRIFTQNYLSCRMDYNQHDWTRVQDSSYRIPANIRLLCRFINGNIDKRVFTTSTI